MGPVAAMILAAGESRRMGTLKPLLPYGSGTVIQAVVRSLKACPIRDVLVVLGHRSEEIEAALRDEGVRTILNPRYREGMLASVQAGAAAAPVDAGWLLIALGDQPSLRPSTVRALLDAARSAAPVPAPILVPSHGGRRGHPLLIAASYREEIAALDPEIGLRQLLLRHPDAVRHVEIPDEAVLQDMDTPEEYARELERLRSAGDSPRPG